ncbi:MAG: DUF2254 domain-containing protein [Herminiimonas sp.]|nr:DUF2254 domain-containing protein [Herminiimonas sp.]
MNTKIRAFLESVRASFWFKPSFMALLAVALSFLTVALDRTLTQEWLSQVAWIYSGGAEGASAVLQTISSSMITIAGVVFSLTLVALSLASSQFGSRLLRNFMRDGTNQLVLGTFIATFLYCLLVLRTIRRGDEGVFVPHLSVTLGLVFALASLWMLIFFIHHVAVSIQAEEVIARVGIDLDHVMDRLYPASPDAVSTSPSALLATAARVTSCDFDTDSVMIAADRDGYVQLIDVERLVELAAAENAVFRLERRLGHYTVEGSCLVTASPADSTSPTLAAQVQQAFVIGNQRSAAQDIEFAILQLVEIAVRALSPSINDPFTAIACVDRLGSALSRLAQRAIPPAWRLDRCGAVRVIVEVADFEGLVDAAFNQLRQYSRSNLDVTLRLLETITVIAAVVERREDRAVLRRHADMIFRGTDTTFAEIEDRRAVAERYHAGIQALKERVRSNRQPKES